MIDPVVGLFSDAKTLILLEVVLEFSMSFRFYFSLNVNTSGRVKAPEVNAQAEPSPRCLWPGSAKPGNGPSQT